MTTLKLFVLTMCFMTAANAFGQVDPDPDGIGLYFDEGATINAIEAEVPGPVTAYLIGTNLSRQGGLRFWEAIVSAPGQSATIWGGARNGLNLATNMPPGGNSFVYTVSVSDPNSALPGTVILGDLEIWFDWDVPIGLHVHGVSFDQPAYWVDADPTETHFMYPSSGSVDRPVAMINGSAPVPVEDMAWGHIKGLYR